MSTTSHSETRQLLAWRNAVFLVFFSCGVALASYMSRVPRIRDVLGASTAEMGVLAAAMAVGSIGGMLGSGNVMGKLGSKGTLRWSIGTLTAGALIAGFGATGASYVVLFTGLVIFGLGMGLTDVAMNVSAAANEQRLHRNIMPLFHALFSIGAMAGAGLGALAEYLGISVILHIGTLTVACLVGVLMTNKFVQTELEPARGDVAPAERVSRRVIWAQPQTWFIGLIILGMALAEGSANDWLALAMVDGHGQTNAQGAISLGIFLTAMTVGRVLGIRFLDRFGRVPVLRASAVLAALGLAMVIFLDQPVLVTVGIVAWGLGSALGFPVGMSAAADDLKHAAVRVSAVATIGYIAFLAGPPLIGFVGEQVGLLTALLVVLVFIAIAGLASPAARRREAPIRADVTVG